MAKLYVYDSYENRMLVYNNLNENDPMPYSYGSTLSVREFRGSSNARVLWTTTRAMEAWNLTRRRYGAGIPVGYAFKRIWEGGHGPTSWTRRRWRGSSPAASGCATRSRGAAG